MKTTTEKPEQCSTCKFWEQYFDGKDNPIYGKCFRFPPTAQRVPSVGHERLFPAVFEWVKNWPRPDAEDVCGEYQPSEDT